MANETIELLKNYEPSKMRWPAMLQPKIDGVPVRVFKGIDNKMTALTRQGERVTSIPHILQFASTLLHPGESMVMELHISGKPFKEISGHVRRKNTACPELVGWVFDFADHSDFMNTYFHRYAMIKKRIEQAAVFAQCKLEDLCIRIMPAVNVYTQEEAEAAHDAFMLNNPNAEGNVLHSWYKVFQPGKRCWGTQRMKPVPTIDLMVVGFEEAHSADGAPLGMVGRIIADFNSFGAVDHISGSKVLGTIGVGPGALNHTERKDLWRMWKRGQFTPRIAEIRYMRDDSYDALRQPTFKQWRDDKHEPDTKEVA
jgi:ATP-dependent DNA ligase